MKLRQFIHCAGIAAAVACFNAPLNASAAVESPIVGYQTISLTQKFTLVGINFSPLTAKDAPAPCLLNDVISGDFEHGDQIQIQDGYGYKRAGWNSRLGKWCDVKLNGTVLDDVSPHEVTPGVGFWVVAKNATSDHPVQMKTCGQVLLGSPVSFACGQKYSIVTSTMPEALTLNSDAWTFAHLTAGDQIQIQDGYGYKRAGWNSKLGKWCDIKLNGTVLDDVSPLAVPPGTAFWLVTQSRNATCTFLNPVKK